MFADDLTIVLPEVLLTGFAMVALMVGVYFRGSEEGISRLILWATAAVMAVMAERQVMGPPTGLGRMLAAPTIATRRPRWC